MTRNELSDLLLLMFLLGFFWLECYNKWTMEETVMKQFVNDREEYTVGAEAVEEPALKQIVDVALEAGTILLKNGAEIFRVEETIHRICHRFHVDQVDVFTVSHGLFITADNGTDVYTKIKHVPLSSAQLEIVVEVNELSREIDAGRVGLEEARARLKELEAIPPKRWFVKLIAAGCGSMGFGFLLGATVLESMIAFVIGVLVYIWVLFAEKYKITKIITNIGGGVVMMMVALVARAVFPGIHMENMISGAVMPLVPGVAFVNAIRDMADSDFLAGTVRMLDALLVFVYIAVGVAITLSAYKMMTGGTLLL